MTDQLSLEQALDISQNSLKPNSDTAGQDAQVLLAHILGKNRAWVLAHLEYELTPRQTTDFKQAVEKLSQSIPLPYILGEWEFYGRKFHLTPNVLIPRPETELLIETALAWLKANPKRQTVLDVGTGSGIIAVTLAAEVPDLKVTGSDVSLDALEAARENAAKHNTTISFIESNLLSNIDQSFDLICANLPYIPSQNLKKLAVFGKEPTLALDGGSDGLDLIRELLDQATSHLNPGGLMLLEVDASHTTTAPKAAQKVFPKADIAIKKDLAGHTRLLTIQT